MNVPSVTVPVNLTGKTLLKIVFEGSVWVFKMFHGDGTTSSHFHLRYNKLYVTDGRLLEYAKELGLNFYAYRIVRPKKTG